LNILAGADIKEMQNNTLAQVIGQGFLDQWSAITRVKKPIIAAVNGFAVNLKIFFFLINFYLYLIVRWWL
jgi:enoyl-CoA hydratase/carnithine racemase